MVSTRARSADTPTRFLLRLPAAVHTAVKRDAEVLALSINEYCVRRLRAPAAPLALEADAQALIARAADMLDDRLVGLVLHGSFARGDARQTSDVDALIVVETSIPLTRSLYRTWDSEPVTWGARPVDSHFVHLPEDPSQAGSVWCEAAIEGVVLIDPRGQVDAALRQVRRAIAVGRLVRKQVHGHPYWTKVA